MSRPASGQQVELLHIAKAEDLRDQSTETNTAVGDRRAEFKHQNDIAVVLTFLNGR